MWGRTRRCCPGTSPWAAALRGRGRRARAQVSTARPGQTRRHAGGQAQAARGQARARGTAGPGRGRAGGRAQAARGQARAHGAAGPGRGRAGGRAHARARRAAQGARAACASSPGKRAAHRGAQLLQVRHQPTDLRLNLLEAARLRQPPTHDDARARHDDHELAVGLVAAQQPDLLHGRQSAGGGRGRRHADWPGGGGRRQALAPPPGCPHLPLAPTCLAILYVSSEAHTLLLPSSRRRMSWALRRQGSNSRG